MKLSKDPEWISSWLLIGINSLIIVPSYLLNFFFISIITIFLTALFFTDKINTAGIFLDKKKVASFFSLKLFLLMFLLVFFTSKELPTAVWTGLLTGLLGGALTYVGMINQ